MTILKLNSNYGDQTLVRLLNLLLGLCAHFLIKSRNLRLARTLLSHFSENLPLNSLLDIWSLSIPNLVSHLPPSPRWPWPVLSKNLVRPVYPDLPFPLMLPLRDFPSTDRPPTQLLGCQLLPTHAVLREEPNLSHPQWNPVHWCLGLSQPSCIKSACHLYQMSSDCFSLTIISTV